MIILKTTLLRYGWHRKSCTYLYNLMSLEMRTHHESTTTIMLLLLLLLSHSVVSDSVWSHRRQPTRLPHPWDSPGKNTGVGCHFLLQCMKVKSESEVAQSCPTLSDPMDCSPPGSSVHGILQARVLEWGASAFSYHHQGHWQIPHHVHFPTTPFNSILYVSLRIHDLHVFSI